MEGEGFEGYVPTTVGTGQGLLLCTGLLLLILTILLAKCIVVNGARTQRAPAPGDEEQACSEVPLDTHEGSSTTSDDKEIDTNEVQVVI